MTWTVQRDIVSSRLGAWPQGKVEETAGKLTGNRDQEAQGQAKQAQGHAQGALGDVQDAVRGPKK